MSIAPHFFFALTNRRASHFSDGAAGLAHLPAAGWLLGAAARCAASFCEKSVIYLTLCPAISAV
jgi:hypothetical protein